MRCEAHEGLVPALAFVQGPLGVRVYGEILIIFFRINETLTEIKPAMGHRPPEM